MSRHPGVRRDDQRRALAFDIHCAGLIHAAGHLAERHRAGPALFGNAEGCAEHDAGGLGIDLGLAAGVGHRLLAGLIEKFRGLRHRETDAADIVGARGHQRVDHVRHLGDVVHADSDAIAGAVADDGRGPGAVRRALRL